ncbi:MAG: S1 family peptidase [Archangiaceae bacterium]|nr:S1 family peptidase [Archangiaceae bacterium]
MRKTSLLLSLTCCALASCGPALEPLETATHRAEIIGGTLDVADTSAVMIRASLGSQSGYCSGVVVSQHVVLTAAHCVISGASYLIFLGDDWQAQATQAELKVPVDGGHTHPLYDRTTNAHDIGVLITERPMNRPAAKLYRETLTAAAVGRTVRLVGFGQTDAHLSSSFGKRYQGVTTISAVDPGDLTVTGTPNICLDDSGGPAYLPSDAGETVVAIHYLLDSASCDSHGYSTRVDPHLEFIDQQIALADPFIDAGWEDAGTPDAGAPDAGAVGDAGQEVDAGTSDVPPPRGCSTSPTWPLGGLGALSLLARRCLRARNRVCSA